MKRANIEKKIEEMDLKLPTAPTPAGNYLPYVKVGNLLYLSGTIPIIECKVPHEGKVGEKHTIGNNL